MPRGVVYVNLSGIAGGGDLRVERPNGDVVFGTKSPTPKRSVPSERRNGWSPLLPKVVETATNKAGNVSDEYEDCDDDDGRSFFAVDANEEQLCCAPLERGARRSERQWQCRLSAVAERRR